MALSQHQKTAFAITTGTLTLCALFMAQGVTGLVAGWVLGSADAEDGAPARPTMASRRPTPTTKRRSIDNILSRNIFDSEQGDPRLKPADPTEVGEGDELELPEDGELPACDSSVKLVASVYNTRAPDWSFASLQSGSETPMLFRAGQTVGSHEVVGIYPQQVHLKSSGRLCRLAMFDVEDSSPRRPPRAVRSDPEPRDRPQAPKREGAIDDDEMDSAISKVSDTQYNVQRSLVDKLLQNQAELMRTARVIPHQENGRTVGVKLYGIRRNSLLGRLGIQNGDMLRTINGFDLSAPDSALEAYTRLREAKNLTIALTRRGQNLNMNFNIQ